MQQFDDTLRNLAEKIQQKGSDTLKLNASKKQQTALQQKADALKAQLSKENADVVALEGHSLSALFYAMIGQKVERLEKERAEAYAAKAKYDAALRELAAVEEDVAFYRRKLADLAQCEVEYQDCLAQKAAALKAENPEAAAALLALEEIIAQQTHQRKELREAFAAGDVALGTVAQILKHLDSAEGWGTFDVLGGGLMTDIAKHNELDTAQKLVETLQGQLRRFQTELADVQVTGAVQISIEGFLGFADFFFDGIFADWMVLDKIKNATAQVKQTEAKIRSVKQQLWYMEQAAEESLQTATAERDALIVAS